MSSPHQRGVTMRLADFTCMAEALDYAATSSSGMNFYLTGAAPAFALSYAEIRTRARQLARGLLALGLQRGDRVGIVADMHPDFVCLFFACQYAGLISVPLPVVTRLGGRQGYQKQLARVLETSAAKAAFGADDMVPHLRDAAAGLPVQHIGSVAVLENSPAGLTPLQPLRAGEMSHIQYSSGSTRDPQGIMISQDALLANARSIAIDGARFVENERVASWLPFYHDMGLIGCLIVPVACQASVDYLHTDAFARRPLQWLQIISDNRCTISFSPTFGYDICARRAASLQALDLDLSCWRYAGIGGDMISPEIFANFAETFAAYGFSATALTPSYGLAEATLAVSFGEPGQGITAEAIDKTAMAADGVAHLAAPGLKRSQLRRFASCGRTMPGYQLAIRNESGTVLSDRHIGSVYIKGPSLMLGYYRNAEATAACMPGDGWLNTGDMGYLSNGELFITGRCKDMMIVNGRNIWPQDLEWHAETVVEALRSRDTAAFTIDDLNDKEVPVLLVQCRTAIPESRAQLQTAVHAAVLRNTGIDCRVELIPPRSLPYTTSGKLSRAKAKRSWLAGEYSLEPAQGAAAIG